MMALFHSSILNFELNLVSKIGTRSNCFIPIHLHLGVVYRARPLLSLAGSWGRGVGKAREGLADVISIHELLANELLSRYLSHPLIGTEKHHVPRTLNLERSEDGCLCAV